MGQILGQKMSIELHPWQEDEAKFLETAVIFAHHAAEFLRNHRTYIANDDTMVVQMEYILRCI